MNDIQSHNDLLADCLTAITLYPNGISCRELYSLLLEGKKGPVQGKSDGVIRRAVGELARQKRVWIMENPRGFPRLPHLFFPRSGDTPPTTKRGYVPYGKLPHSYLPKRAIAKNTAKAQIKPRKGLAGDQIKRYRGEVEHDLDNLIAALGPGQYPIQRLYEMLPQHSPKRVSNVIGANKKLRRYTTTIIEIPGTDAPQPAKIAAPTPQAPTPQAPTPQAPTPQAPPPFTIAPLVQNPIPTTPIMAFACPVCGGLIARGFTHSCGNS